MSKSIIEKLGITPGPWKTFKIEGMLAVVDDQDSSVLSVVYEDETPFAVVYDDEDAKLIAAAPEMLEALIDAVIFMEEVSSDMDISHLKHYRNKIAIIEKATGKSWEEIKELLNA